METTFTILKEPYRLQRRIMNDGARFRAVVAGRRSGKSLLALFDLIVSMAQVRNGLGWYCAPTYSIGQRVFDLIPQLSNDEGFMRIRRGERSVEFFNGAKIYWVSADRPETLVGSGLDRLVVDECGLIPKGAFYESLLPTLADKDGKCLAIGTPKGKGGIFWELYNRGISKDPRWSAYSAYHCSSHANPYLDPSILDELRQSMPEAIYNQEIMAQFSDSQGTVFKGFMDCVVGDDIPVEPGQIVIGCDLARLQDWTVLTAMECDSGRVVEIARFNQLDWSVQVEWIKQFAARHGDAPVLVDSTGVGDAVFPSLRDAGVLVEGYKFTQETKAVLIQNLMRCFEQREVGIPDNEKLLEELRLYDYEISEKTGRVSYQAMPGGTDDMVISLALAAFAKQRYGVPMAVLI